MNIWDPYDVCATRFPPDPRHLQFGLYMPVFGSKQRCWVVHASVGFEMLVLVVHIGAQLKTCIEYAFWQSLLGCFMFVVAVNNGIAL